MDPNVVILKIFPGITPQTVECILNIPHLKGVVLETYGTGNAPSKPWFLDMLKTAVSRGVVIVNVTQCSSGSVQMSLYGSGNKLAQAGIISGYDSTTEAAVTKLMFLFGHGLSSDEVKEQMRSPLTGEYSIQHTEYQIEA